MCVCVPVEHFRYSWGGTGTHPVRLSIMNYDFHWIGPYADSIIEAQCLVCVCVSVPSQNTHFRVSGRPMVKDCSPNIVLQWHNWKKVIVKTPGFAPPPKKNTNFWLSCRLLVKGFIPIIDLQWNNFQNEGVFGFSLPKLLKCTVLVSYKN